MCVHVPLTSVLSIKTGCTHINMPQWGKDPQKNRKPKTQTANPTPKNPQKTPKPRSPKNPKPKCSQVASFSLEAQGLPGVITP